MSVMVFSNECVCVWLQCARFFVGTFLLHMHMSVYVCGYLWIFVNHKVLATVTWPVTKVQENSIAVVTTTAIGLVKTIRHLQVERNGEKENERVTFVSHMPYELNQTHLTNECSVCRNA